MRTPEEILRAAADYIEEHGWFQGNYCSDDGRVCMLGAIAAVTCGLAPPGVAPAYLADESYCQAREFLEDILFRSAAAYNDDEGRTQAEVLAVLRGDS